MGRAIDQDNRLDDHERRIKLVEDALEEMIQTKVHHVDLEGLEVKPDEEFTAPKTPVMTKKTSPRTKRTKATTATT